MSSRLSTIAIRCSKTYALLLVFWTLAGCAAAPAPPPALPTPPAPAPTSSEAAPAAAKPKEVVPAAVPEPPATCAAYASHATAGCTGKVGWREALAAALAEADPEKRDVALACLEGASDAPAGVVRALRAELAPEVCADVLVTPLLEAPPPGLAREIESALSGSLVAARLARLLADPPKPVPPVTKERFGEFFRDTLTPWVLSQAAAIEKLSLEGSRLSGYGRGVAAIAAGNADLRFVEMVRDVPLPDEMKADKDVREVYYGALDEALEPRKLRGRDAALVGLRAFAELGALHDPRVARARTLLAKLWSGSRVDALDRLLLPELGPLDTSTPPLQLAARLPTFYAGWLLKEEAAGDAPLLRALLERGVPAPFRERFAGAKADAVRLLYARALIESGRCYFRASDFKKARALLGAAGGEGARFLAALARPLEKGPEGAGELLVKGPFPPSTDDVSELDAEVQRKGRNAGRAAFDAAYLLQLAPPADDPAFWEGIAARFGEAGKLLKREGSGKDTLVLVKTAADYADAARATAASLRAKK
jgi:hypothetical protein